MSRLSSADRDEARKAARDDLIRVQADHERKLGNPTPNMREIERSSHERADRLDKHKDQKIKGSYISK